MRITAFIPARGGSQGTPLKNMLILGDKPLVGWSLEAACQSDVFDHVVVSTDNSIIAEYCESNYPEAEVIERPADLCGANSPVHDTVWRYVRNLPRKHRPIAIALFQPTSPFVRQYQIEELALKLNRRTHHCAYTITKVPHNYHWMNQRTTENGIVKFRHPSHRERCYNKQLKEQTYKFGNLVITEAQFLQAGMFVDPAVHLEIDRFDACDIDDMTDYKVAQTMVEAGYWENGDR